MFKFIISQISKRGLLSIKDKFLNLTLVDPSLQPIKALIFDIILF